MSTSSRIAATPAVKPSRRRVEPVYWLFLFPAVAVFTLLITCPAIEGITMSFTNSIGVGDFEWIGFRNYVALFQDENILSSYSFTFLFAAVTVLLVNVIAFVLALGLTARIRFTNPLRAIFVIPMVISAIIYSFVFRFLFNNSLPELGAALGSETLSSSLLANENWAWLAIVIVTTWGSIPSAMLIYIAGLTTVPAEVYEASSIDGASPWRNLWHITVPLVAGYVGINLIIGFKNYLSVYDQIVGLTQGGPGTATRSVAFTIFAGFSGGDYAYQMANAAVFFVITILIALVQLRLTPGKVPIMTAPLASGVVAAPAAATSRRTRVRQERTNWTATTLLILASLTVLVPLYVTVMMAFKTAQQSTDLNAFSLPSPWSVTGFVEAWSLTNFPRAFAVSLMVTAVAVTGAILVSAMAAYAIVRNRDNRIFRYAFYYLLAAMFIPFPVVALPQVRLTGLLGLDNYFGVALLHIVFGLAFNTLLFSTFLRPIPLELEESMRMDGASAWQTFWKLIFPLLAPMAATVGIFAFLGSWNDFMMPSLIISQPEWQTIPVVNNIFQTQFSNNYNVSFASYLMAMAPAIIVYILAQRWVMSGLTQGAIK